MAALMAIFAIGMVILVISYAKQFTHRGNPNTSSVGGGTESCKRVTQANTTLLLLINTCATMVLGMSNTYQQLVTSLKISDLKHALSKFGDSRVGTNSPFSIKHKQNGKRLAWAAWVLLILTSMPVHFLANSLIGPSWIQQLPRVVEYQPVANKSALQNMTNLVKYAERLDGYMSFPCWSALRTGVAHYPTGTDLFSADSGTFSASQERFGTTWKRMKVIYIDKSCGQYVNTTTDKDLDMLASAIVNPDSYYTKLGQGNCTLTDSVTCTLHDPEPSDCRLNVRMSAAFILMACLGTSRLHKK
jgi:hypothetical protein